MKQFTSRQKQIINIISNVHTPITGKELSQALNVSMRTIQSEISSINKSKKIINSSHKGYFLTQELYNINNEIVQSQSDDEHIILNNILITETSFQIDEFADSLYMSRTTLENKLKKCNHFLKPYHLKIEKNKNHIYVSGKESDKRRCIKDFIINETIPAFISIQNLEHYFSDIDFSRIEKIILSTIQKHGYTIDEPYRTNVVINTVIALHRMRTNHYVENNSSYVKNETESYLIAQEICQIYGNHWSIHPMKDDITYIGSLLIGQMKPISSQIETNTFKNVISSQFINKINNILNSAFQSYSLHIDSSQYLYGFSLHIDSMIKRIKTTYPVNNDLLDNIKKNCPFIYDVAVKIAHKLEKQFQIQIPDTEIGYIFIHIGFLIESSIDNNTKVNVALYGTEYHQILTNIKNRIESEYKNFMNLTIIEKTQFDILSQKKWDLIITTQPLEIIGQQVIMISPFYTLEDQTCINLAIKNCVAISERKKQTDLFSNYFHKDLWFKNTKFSTKEEVIQFLGNKLIHNGVVQSDFIHSVLERERLSSTCFYGNFAIPHALEMNAKKTMVCVMTSESCIQWNDKAIHLVLMITIQENDRKKFMELYNGIVKVLKNQKNISPLISANTFDEFMQSLKNAVYEF